jgi:hypothetical protein
MADEVIRVEVDLTEDHWMNCGKKSMGQKLELSGLAF